MSKRILQLVLIASLGVNVGVIATTLAHRAGGPPPGRPMGPGNGAPPDAERVQDPARLAEDHVMGMTQHLDLDEAQQQAVRSIMDEHSPRLVELQSEVRAVSRRLSDAFAAPTFDADRFRRLTAEAGAARARLDSLAAVMLVAEAAVLDPEQRRKFAAVAPSMHSNPQGPRRDAGRPPREGEPPPR